MKKTRIIFIFLFLACGALPLIFIDNKTKISMLERRQLASLPWLISTGRFSKKYLAALPRQTDAYITDRFGGRSALIFFMNNVNYFVLGKNHDNRLLVGKDKWLFYIDKSIGDEFANFKKTNLFNEEELWAFLKSITLINDYCETNNIKFLFMVVPDKPSVYPEKYPFPRPEGISLIEQILAGLPENIRAKVIFPLDYFMEKKKECPYPLYFNNGLHWTKMGVYYTYELLYEKLKAWFTNIPEPEFKFTPYMDYGEDNYALWWGIKKFGAFMELVNIEPVDGWGSHYEYIICKNVPMNEFNRRESVDAMRGKFGIVTKNTDRTLPKALIMRDSYFVALEPFISSIFSEVEYVWTQPEKRNVQYLIELPDKPDVFIWEIGERGLRAISKLQPGIFPYD